MKINTLFYLFKEGCKNLWTSRKTAISSFIIILATMLILGIFMLITNNIESLMNTVKSEQAILVYLEDIDDEKTNNVRTQIEGLYSVAEIEYTSKSEALQKIKDDSDEKLRSAIEGYEGEDNPFHAFFTVKLSNLEQIDNLKKQIEKFENVRDVVVGNDTADKLIVIAKYVNYAIFALLVVLLAISVFIISNSIKITMYARRKEISIMKYVGATDSFIRLPFIIEGIIIGLVGAVIATLIIGGIYSNIYASVQNSGTNIVQSVYKNAMVPFSEILNNLIIVYIALGVGIGIIGSSMSIKKYLDV